MIRAGLFLLPTESPARPDRPASRTEIAAVLPDHRQIPALVAQLAGGRLRGGAAGGEREIVTYDSDLYIS